MTADTLTRPAWLTKQINVGNAFAKVDALVAGLKLDTVCRSAHCPNMGECFRSGTATFLILGGVCTRSCRFCAVPKGSPAGPDDDEPARVAEAVVKLNLRHAVVTSVTRDDLPNGGARQFVACIEHIRSSSPATTVEVLVPDFAGNLTALDLVLAARPDVLNHNIETVPRLYKEVRPQADYQRSLAMLARAADMKSPIVKSGLMVGLGETPGEILSVISDLAAAGVNALTIGQYLSPSADHLPVMEYIHPDIFAQYEAAAHTAGIKRVAAGPFVRSSYNAASLLKSPPKGALTDVAACFDS